MKFFFLSSYLMFFKILNVIFYSYKGHMFYTCNSSSHLSSSGFRIACMFDELYNFKCREIQKLILVYHESHLMQAKILSMIHKP